MPLHQATAKRLFPSLAVLLFLASAAHAGTLLDPVSASTNMPGPAANLVTNQSGLVPGYTSGVTQLNPYLATNPIYIGSSASGTPIVITLTGWLSNTGNTTGNFDFNLGGSMSIDAFLFWNTGLLNGTVVDQNVKDFTLLASNDSSFTSPTTIGTFTSNPTSDAANVRVEVFPFSQTFTASYVRMEITSNYGSTRFVGFDQAAFDAVPAVLTPVAAPVPVPPAFWSGAIVLLGLGLAAKFRKNRQPASR